MKTMKLEPCGCGEKEICFEIFRKGGSVWCPVCGERVNIKGREFWTKRGAEKYYEPILFKAWNGRMEAQNAREV